MLAVGHQRDTKMKQQAAGRTLHLGPSRRALRLGRRDELLGLLGGFITALALWIGFQGLEDASAGILVGVAVIAAPGAVLLALALALRRRKLRLLEVWHELEEHRDVPVDRLTTLGGLGRDELLEGVAKINRAAREAYLLDAERDTLVDSRLRGRALVVDRCAACGAPVNVSVEVGRADSVRCESCGSPVVGSASALVQRALAEAEAESAGAAEEAARRKRRGVGARAEKRHRDGSDSAAGGKGMGGGLRSLGCGLLFLVGMPFLLVSMMIGLIFIVPAIGGLVIWETVRHRFAPRSERETRRDLAAAAAARGGSVDVRSGFEDRHG